MFMTMFFFRFPKDVEIKNQWLQIINSPKWAPTKYSAVCSKHFTLECYDYSTPAKWRRLAKDAVPLLHLTNDVSNSNHINDCCRRRSKYCAIER